MAKYEYWLTGEGLTLLNGWARDGLTNEQIADNCGISRETLNQWRRKFIDISDALKSGKEVADYRVENALYNAALSGNITAMIFWLKNRRPDKWRDKPDEATNAEKNEVGGVIILPDVREASSREATRAFREEEEQRSKV